MRPLCSLIVTITRFVVDTDTHSLLSAVRTGDRPWHVYAVPARDEAWVHLDQSARFDVFHMSQARYRRASGAVVSTVNNGHGACVRLCVCGFVGHVPCAMVVFDLHLMLYCTCEHICGSLSCSY